MHTRRHRGRGRSLAGISSSHDQPSSELIIHFAWDYITVSDRKALCAASPTFGSYARLRLAASSKPIAAYNGLRSIGPVSGLSKTISRNRAQRLAQLALLLDFNIGDIIRWLGGAYTHDHIPLGPIRQAVAALRKIPTRDEYPVQDYDRALHILGHTHAHV